jgi:hypothetical protein
MLATAGGEEVRVWEASMTIVLTVSVDSAADSNPVGSLTG